ncbi:hypothetical protein SLE2022_140320 [Rubroshorea leprosula]
MAKAKELPVDLHRDIIGRLSDPKSVYRFKTVSKSWFSLIAEIKRVELVVVSKERVYSADLNLDLDLDWPGCSLKVKEQPLPYGIMEGSTLFPGGSCNGQVTGDFQVITQTTKVRVPQPCVRVADRFVLSGFDTRGHHVRLLWDGDGLS